MLDASCFLGPFYPGTKELFWAVVFTCPCHFSYVSSCSADDEGFNVRNVAELESDQFVSNSVISHLVPLDVLDSSCCSMVKGFKFLKILCC